MYNDTHHSRGIVCVRYLIRHGTKVRWRTDLFALVYEWFTLLDNMFLQNNGYCHIIWLVSLLYNKVNASQRGTVPVK